jgi:predicted HicB family RNase H-like nuclease
MEKYTNSTDIICVFMCGHIKWPMEVIMAQTEAQLRASKKYHEKFDDLRIRVPAGEKHVIEEHASSLGESVNAFVRRAIIETMERDNHIKLND